MPRPFAAAILLCAPFALAQSKEPAGVRVRVENPAGAAQERVVAAAVPFARGTLRLEGAQKLTTITAREIVEGDEAAEGAGKSDGVELQGVGVPTLRWPDGSVALVSAQWRVAVPQGAVRTFAVDVVRKDGAVAAPFTAAPHRLLVPEALPLHTELVDPWGRVLRADLKPDPAAGPGGVELDTGLVRVRRFRSTHRLQDGPEAGHSLLDLCAWLVTFDGDRRAELTLVLDNRDPVNGPLGPVRFSAFRVCVTDRNLKFVPAFVRENLLSPAAPRGEGTVVQDLMPNASHYLGDGTAKAFRLHLFWDDASLTDAERELASWAPVRLAAFADVDQTRATRAWGAFGGPAPVIGSDFGDDGSQLRMWRENARFGPYGGFGDLEDARRGGSPRHGDSLLHNVLRWRSDALFAVAEGMALQHALRPTGGRATRLPKDTEPYRRGLQAHALEAPHGFSRIDYEHVSAQLLFDYQWLAADPFARDELRRVGRSVLAMLKAVEFRTGRGEGHCLEAGALAAMATGDDELLAALVAHAKSTLLPMLKKDGPCVLPQRAHPLVLDGKSPFDATAQMAALLRGLAALHRASGDAALVPPIAAIADAMAGPAWIEGEGPKTFVSAVDPGRYSMAAMPEDRSGNDRTLIGAFLVAADLVDDAGRADLWRRRAAFLLEREIVAAAALSDQLIAAANPWLQVALDRRKQN